MHAIDDTIVIINEIDRTYVNFVLFILNNILLVHMRAYEKYASFT